jgi:hypothetical protein
MRLIVLGLACLRLPPDGYTVVTHYLDLSFKLAEIWCRLHASFDKRAVFVDVNPLAEELWLGDGRVDKT